MTSYLFGGKYIYKKSCKLFIKDYVIKKIFLLTFAFLLSIYSAEAADKQKKSNEFVSCLAPKSAANKPFSMSDKITFILKSKYYAKNKWAKALELMIDEFKTRKARVAANLNPDRTIDLAASKELAAVHLLAISESIKNNKANPVKIASLQRARAEIITRYFKALISDRKLAQLITDYFNKKLGQDSKILLRGNEGAQETLSQISLLASRNTVQRGENLEKLISVLHTGELEANQKETALLLLPILDLADFSENHARELMNIISNNSSKTSVKKEETVKIQASPAAVVSVQNVGQQLAMVPRIQQSIENTGCAVILGAPGSGKTEQMQLAIGNPPLFDVREEFLNAYYLEQGISDKEGQKKAKNDYMTSIEFKAKELEWIHANRTVLMEKILGKGDTIVFDEFDLAVGEQMEGVEIETASMLIDMAKEAKNKGKKIILIIHSKGLRTPGFIDSMVKAGLLPSEKGLLKTEYLTAQAQSELLKFAGLENISKDIIADTGGIPAAYLELIESAAKAKSQGMTTFDYKGDHRKFIATAEKTVGKNYNVAVKTANSMTVKLLNNLASNAKFSNDPEVLSMRKQLLDTGLVREIDGTMIMSPLVRRVINRFNFALKTSKELTGVPADYRDYLDTPHFNKKYHQEGGINAALSDHLMMMREVAENPDGLDIDSDLKEIMKSFSSDTLEAYILTHDIGKKTTAKSKPDGLSYGWSGHERKSYDVVMSSELKHKGKLLKDINKALPVVIAMHIGALEIDTDRYEYASLPSVVLSSILQREFNNLTHNLAQTWRETYNSEPSESELKQALHLLIAATILDTLGQKPENALRGTTAAARLLLDLYKRNSEAKKQESEAEIREVNLKKLAALDIKKEWKKYLQRIHSQRSGLISQKEWDIFFAAVKDIVVDTTDTLPRKFLGETGA